jgi:hypothetical protein
MFESEVKKESLGNGYTLSITRGGFSNSTPDTWELAVLKENEFVTKEIMSQLTGDELADDVVGYADDAFVEKVRTFLKLI